MKAYYISGCIPYNGKSGGRLASYNHIKKICNEYDEVEAFFVDMHGDIDELEDLNFPNNLKYTVYPKECSKFNPRSFTSIFILMYQILFSLMPRSLFIGRSNKLILDIYNIYKKDNENLFIFENIDSCGNLKFNFKYIYICHNVESKLSFDAIKYAKKIKIPFYYLNAIKMYFFERKVLKNSIKNVFISDKDMSNLSNFGPSKLYPEFIGLKNNLWNLSVTNKSVLFLGSAHHFPNQEAASWLLYKLSELLFKLDPDITINICGMKFSDIKNNSSEINHFNNVKFLGKVSDEELQNQFLVNRLFISPIILGSGIKMKVLEAASYGMPIIATPESIEGLSYLKENVIILEREDLIKFSEKLVVTINSLELLKSMSINLVEKVKKNSTNYEKYFT
ncbi:glycosyltransferase family 4 protein [Acinetobacter pollinis]|uniref:Glycosyltransferase family 4 protein n=1 Tax=Acinetobacter pollinis TaxID=2605270 RepID=A0ABU6DSI8_9GAMM|nr:glycosyltransferase [Acinetobacter pollinis]MEB5476805.1 glycosyltransferase family 4 protein [Acinetobacter pollinis]